MHQMTIAVKGQCTDFSTSCEQWGLKLDHQLTRQAATSPSFLFFFLCFFCLLFVFRFFRNRVSLYSPGCPGTHSVEQAGLELRNPPASASQMLGLKACATTTQHGPRLFNKALKHLIRTKATGNTRFCNRVEKDRVLSFKRVLAVLLTCLCGLPDVPSS